jgi:hypothetical protein
MNNGVDVKIAYPFRVLKDSSHTGEEHSSGCPACGLEYGQPGVSRPTAVQPGSRPHRGGPNDLIAEFYTDIKKGVPILPSSATRDGGGLRTPKTVRPHPLAANEIGRAAGRSDTEIRDSRMSSISRRPDCLATILVW